MGMKLTAEDLIEIATVVGKIKAAKLDVEVVTVRGHRVLLKRRDSQMDGLEYHIIGITDSKLGGEIGKVMREADDDRKPDYSKLAGGQPRRGGNFR